MPDAGLLEAAALQLERPALLALGLLAVLLLVGLAWLRGPPRIRVPALTGRRRPRRRLQPGWGEPAWLLSVLLRAAALALLLAALAGPAALVPERRSGGEGIDLVLALDASGSMRALDGHLEGRRVTRLALARRIVADFVRQRDGDRIGLVVFGAHAFTQCPLTVDHRMVLETLDRIEVGLAGDATALGEAVGLATRRLRAPGAPADARRVLVLFTDGRHNAGRLAPETAAEIARAADVRIHAVGIGGTGPVPFAQDTPGEPLRFERVDLDAETLRRVATTTGGEFFHAAQPADLARVLEVINRLEARPRAAPPRQRRASLVPLALGAALALLLAETLTTHGALRRLP